MNSRLLVWLGVLVLGVLIGCDKAIDQAIDQASPPDLFTLCQTGTVHQVRDAIAAGADVNAKDRLDWTPLVYAARYCHNPKMVVALVKAGADVNAKDVDGKSVLQYGQKNANPKVLTELIKAGAK